MRILTKKAIRDVLSLGWRAVAISFITALGVGQLGGGFMARDSLTHTRDFYYESLKLADLDVYFNGVDAKDLPRLPLRGTTHVARFVYQTSLDMPGKEPISIVLIHQRQTGRYAVNDVKLIEGSRLKDGDKEGILIDRSFAKEHRFKVGDTLGLRSMGFPVQYTIRGIVISPEYLVPMGSPHEMIPIKGSLGVAFATMGRVEEDFGYPFYNNLAFLYDPKSGADKESVLKELKKLEITRVSTRKDQFSYKWLEQDLKVFNIFTPSVVFLLGMVVCVVTIMVFNRLVQGQRREIGVLMALGNPRRRIFFSFLITSIALGLLGGLIGMALVPFNCWGLASMVGAYLEMPPVLYVYPAQFFIAGFFIGFLLPVLSSILPLYEIFKLTPQDAIRHTESGRSLARELDVFGIFAFRSLAFRFSVRNLIRRPDASLATVALVALAIAIMTAFYASTQSWNYYAEKALGQEKWDIISTFRAPLTPAEAQKIWNKKELSNIRPFSSRTGVVRGKKFVKDFVIRTENDMRESTDVEFTEGGYFTSPDAFEVILSKVDHLPIKAGEQVVISADKKEYTFKVVGILNRMTTGLAYLPKGTAKKLIQENATGFYANSSVSPKEIKNLLYQDENVAWVQIKSDIKVAVLEFLAQAMVVTQIALWVSIGMAMLFLLTGITINIRDREGEYATLASLGYSGKFLTRVILFETMLEGILGLIVSIPLAFLFAKFLNYELGKALFQMDLYFGAKELVEVMAYAFAFLPIAALPGIRHILTLDIPMAVRRKSFG